MCLPFRSPIHTSFKGNVLLLKVNIGFINLAFDAHID